MTVERSETPSPDKLEVLQISDAQEWDRWLEEYDQSSPGVWLKIAKKNARVGGDPVTTVNHAQALDVAICHGWIDGQVRPVDAYFFLRRFTPRKRASRWSQVNCEKAMALIESGRMRPAGLAQVRAAQADGRWDAAYAPQKQATVPGDLQRALDASPRAAEFFATLTGARRYAFLYRLHHVRDPDRRAQRIADYIELLSQHRTLN